MSTTTIRAETEIELELEMTNVEVERGIRYFWVNLNGKYIGQVAWEPHRDGYELDGGVERMLQLPIHGAPRYRNARQMKEYITNRLQTLVQYKLNLYADALMSVLVDEMTEENDDKP